jgi:hypothetical protein
MRRFVEGIDREQATLFPECLEDWIDQDNPVRARQGGVPSCSILTKATRVMRTSGLVFRTICTLVQALRAPLSISRYWRKKKRVTTTDETGYWK